MHQFLAQLKALAVYIQRDCTQQSARLQAYLVIFEKTRTINKGKVMVDRLGTKGYIIRPTTFDLVDLQARRSYAVVGLNICGY